MRTGYDYPQGGQSQIPGADPNEGNVHPSVALSGRDDTDHSRAEGQSQRSRLASHPIGYPDNSLRGGSRLSPVLSITPITPRIHPMCLNVISPGSRATVCDTVRIHTLPSDLVRLGSSNPKNRFPPFHCHLPSYSASKPRSSRVSSLLLKTFMIKKK